ncbi:hypothetical protein STANM309S_02195 [Streptomyces tanashiensis]
MAKGLVNVQGKPGENGTNQDGHGGQAGAQPGGAVGAAVEEARRAGTGGLQGEDRSRDGAVHVGEGHHLHGAEDRSRGEEDREQRGHAGARSGEPAVVRGAIGGSVERWAVKTRTPPRKRGRR